ncbi:PREDICTED: heterogeneous nuclear ribonucleoprotein 1 [Tarenaya hassleriana]|uniref:heterogeneous nuclear ribonucleoprotein 1 n=1 Tax=Tarenaya hassleriana TaxID=28532 RepID=UPI00053C8121|nr:PREDICTED: heterogeneous nuclear ribonucleoprotein 1 [Tarenaya hassleriana]
MESDQGKLFIGGISWETDENVLREYFSNYGEVLQVTVMREKMTGRPRGFGFVAFSDPAVVDRVLQDKHHIDNRDVDVKRAMSREEQNTSGRSGNFIASRNYDSSANIRTKKIFVGGLPPVLTGDEFRSYFEAYGSVTDAVIMIDQNTQRPRGFGFISFESEDSVDRVLHKTFHDLNGKQVEVKRALPKDANPGGASRGSGTGGSGGYLGYGGSGYEGRMDSNRFMQPQNTGSGYPPYGASGYSAGYGYGNNGVGYGGYGGYGNPAGAPYGNPGAGYGSGPRSSWGAQAPSGYGSVGYGNAAGWGGSGPGSAMPGQAGGPAGYGGQGYGYGGYGGSDSSYGTPSAYGPVGGRSGNMPSSHGGAYGDAAWKPDSDGSGGYGNHQGNGQAGYGGGYGSGRQAQQQ